MRRALAALLLAVAAPVAAQSTDAVRLAPGEVPMRIVADGSARTRADAVTLTVPVCASAPTAAAARAQAHQAVERITRTLAAAGVPAAAITTTAAASALGFVGNEADEDSPAAGAIAAVTLAQNRAPRQASVVLHVRLADPAALDRVQAALDGIDQSMGAARPMLADDTAARSAAVADATAHARAEADAYDAALGMRVGRVLAVGNMPATADPLAAGWTLFAAMQGADGSATQVVTRRRVQIDYALVTR